MRRHMMVISLVVLAGVETGAWAISGNDWKQLGEDSRHAYIAGVTDAWNRIQILNDLAHKKFLTYHPSDVERLFADIGTCISGQRLSYTEITATVTAYVEKRPEESGQDMAVIIYGALSEICKSRPASP